MEDHETIIVNQFQEEQNIRLKIKKLDKELEALRREEEMWSKASFSDKLIVHVMGSLFAVVILCLFYMLARAVGLHLPVKNLP